MKKVKISSRHTKFPKYQFLSSSFIELVNKGNGLNDHVVHSIDIELDLGPGVGVTQTKLCHGLLFQFELFDNLVNMNSDPSANFLS